MTINEIAKQHYDAAVELLTAGCQAKSATQIGALAQLATVSIELAHFAMAHPYLVAGVDEPDVSQDDSPIAPTGGPQPWGGV